ncbi:MAG: nitrogen utilization protein B [Peptococcaceae bacterium BRH_c4a]|nr:MAG: nitrogen utilization protein B [Peptococcaceae bacterium BRH_c4a]
MGRRQAREAAMKTLYQMDVGGIDPEVAIKNTAEIEAITPDDLIFTRELVLGSTEHLSEIDDTIAALSRDWNIERLARVDRNIMRMAIYEILYRDDIPFSVTVNEAVELAKTFGSEDSGKFVNGVLGKVARKNDGGALGETKGSDQIFEGRIG